MHNASKVCKKMQFKLYSMFLKLKFSVEACASEEIVGIPEVIQNQTSSDSSRYTVSQIQNLLNSSKGEIRATNYYSCSCFSTFMISLIQHPLVPKAVTYYYDYSRIQNLLAIRIFFHYYQPYILMPSEVAS